MNGERTLDLLPLDADRYGAHTALPGREWTGGHRSEAAAELTLLDTFDRRLFRCGRSFAVEQAGDDAWAAELREPHAHRTGRRVVLAASTLPRFAWNIPDQRLRSELEAVIGVRALLPQCCVRRVSHPISEFPDVPREGVRMALHRYRLIPGQGAPRAVGERLALSWSAADEKAARRLVDTLLERALAAPAPDDILRQAMALAGTLPDADDAADRPELTPDMRADLAVRRILSSLFDVMERNEAGLIQRIDTEFLHDFRVALRRSRAALGQLRGVFPARLIERHATDLGWLGELTGPSRDLDVYLLHFADFQDLLPDALRQDLRPLHTLLSSKSLAAHAALVKALSSLRYQRFKQRWAAFLKRPLPRRPTAPNALEPIGTLAARRIWRLYRRVSSGAGAIGVATPPEQIHDLRKTCKKLRYLLEFVQPFHDPDKIRRPIKDLKLLQDHLGAFQDADVQLGYLRDWFAELRDKPEVSSAALLAIGVVYGRCEQVQAERRAKIPGALRHLARKEDRIRFKTLFKVAAAPGTAAGPVEPVPG